MGKIPFPTQFVKVGTPTIPHWFYFQPLSPEFLSSIFILSYNYTFSFVSGPRQDKPKTL